MKERTLNGEKRGLKAHGQIAVAKVRSPEATVWSCSPLNASKWLKASDVTLPSKTALELISAAPSRAQSAPLRTGGKR